MSSQVEYNSNSHELINYFASYLRDMTAIITQVKAFAYALINIPQPQPKTSVITTDITSIMSACKKAYDDIKRIQSIIKGHVRGKNSQTELSDSKSQHTNTKNTGFVVNKFTSILNKTELDEALKKDFVSNQVQFSKRPRFEQKKSRIREEETKSTRISNCPHNEEIQANTQAQQHYPSNKQNFSITQSSNKLKETAKIQFQKIPKLSLSKSQQCLSIINRIRGELNISRH